MAAIYIGHLTERERALNSATSGMSEELTITLHHLHVFVRSNEQWQKTPVSGDYTTHKYTDLHNNYHAVLYVYNLINLQKLISSGVAGNFHITG